MPSLPLTILHRLSFLPADALDVIGLAAVLGSAFDVSDLALLARRPVSELVPVLRTAQRAGVIAEQGDRLAFRHELIRDALYEDMPLAVRRGLHAQLAQALSEAGAPPDRVADHLLRGAVPGDARSVAALAQAAREVAGPAPGVAVDLYRQAIALADDPDAQRAALLPEFAETLVSAGLLGEGEAACREALTRDLDPERAGQLRLHLVRLLTRRGRISDAIREGETGLASTALPARDRVELEGWVAMSRVFDGQVEAGVREGSAIVAAGADETAVGLATNGLAMAADARGAFTEAAALIGRNVRWAERDGTRAAYDMRSHMIQSLMLARLDRLDEAEESIRHGRRASEVHGLADAVPVFHYQLAFVDLLRGRLDDALAELATRSQLAEPTEIGWHLSAFALAALIELHRDELLAAERNVIAAEEEAAAGAPPFGTDLMVLARARLLEATGNAVAAVGALAATFDAMAAAGAGTFLPLLGPDLARLAAATGQHERAVGVVPALTAIAALNPRDQKPAGSDAGGAGLARRRSGGAGRGGRAAVGERAGARGCPRGRGHPRPRAARACPRGLRAQRRDPRPRAGRRRAARSRRAPRRRRPAAAPVDRLGRAHGDRAEGRPARGRATHQPGDRRAHVHLAPDRADARLTRARQARRRLATRARRRGRPPRRLAAARRGRR